MLSSQGWEMPTQGAPFSRKMISEVFNLLQSQLQVPQTPAVSWLL